MPHLMGLQATAGADSPAGTADMSLASPASSPPEVEVQEDAQHSQDSTDLSRHAIPIDFAAPAVTGLQIGVGSIDLMPATSGALQREHERHDIDEVDEGLASATRPDELWLEMDREGHDREQVASHGGVGWPGGCGQWCSTRLLLFDRWIFLTFLSLSLLSSDCMQSL